jgi:hypothetical protein
LADLVPRGTNRGGKAELQPRQTSLNQENTILSAMHLNPALQLPIFGAMLAFKSLVL